MIGGNFTPSSGLACGSSGKPHAAIALSRSRGNGDTTHSLSEQSAIGRSPGSRQLLVHRCAISVGTAPARPQSKPSLPSRIAASGIICPRQCGIATPTTDLCSAIAAEYGTARLLALPVNDTPEGYDYPARVRWSLAQDDLTSYQEAAEFLNFNNIGHGLPAARIWNLRRPGGKSYFCICCAGLKMPVVTTLHTVLREPDRNQLMVMEEIAELLGSPHRHEPAVVPVSTGNLQSSRQQRSTWFPTASRICPFPTPNFYKDRFGVEGKAVLLNISACSRRTRESRM